MFSGFLEPHKQVKSMEKEKKPMGFDHQPADTPYLLAFNYGFLANLNKCLKGPIFNTGILLNNIYLFISLIMFLSVHIEIFGIFVKRFKSDFNLLLTKHYNESVFFFHTETRLILQLHRHKETNLWIECFCEFTQSKIIFLQGQ